MPPDFSRANKKKQSTKIKLDDINIWNNINYNTFNMHDRLLNNDNKYVKVIRKSKLKELPGN